MNELMLKINQNPGSIQMNFDELENALDAKLAEYKGAVFTAESKDIGKAELASLRKFKKEFDDARKSIKREWMKPYDEFEARMKVLLAKIDEPIGLIDSQLKEFEENRKAEKRAKISEAYCELIGEMGEYIPLDRIFDPKWENATVSMKSIKEAIFSIVESTKNDIAAISSMQSDAVKDALDIYKNTRNVSDAITYVNQYEQQKIQIMEREKERRAQEEEKQRRAEIERIRAEERERIAREEQIRREEREKVEKDKMDAQILEISESFDDENLPFEQSTTVIAFYKVIATPEELEQVEMAFNSIGIYFERREA